MNLPTVDCIHFSKCDSTRGGCCALNQFKGNVNWLLCRACNKRQSVNAPLAPEVKPIVAPKIEEMKAKSVDRTSGTRGGCGCSRIKNA